MGCLDDNTAVEFASGEMPGPAVVRVEQHLAGCRDCRTLVAALAPRPGESDSDLATPVRPALGKRGARDLAMASTQGRRPSEPRRSREPVVAVGDTIGRYVVLRRIGAGGMGVVFAAYDPQLDRRVALKLLRTGTGLGEGEARARLVREAQAIAQLNHPHVVAVYDVGTAASDEVYVAMEFVEGDTLTRWLHAWERSWRDVVRMFVDAGRGLAAAHAVGLLHRDFKPDNVLVGLDGRVRVTDFGLARSLVTGDDGEARPLPTHAALQATLTATGAVLGTPRYMAPEQLAGRDVSAAADQFSFCVALYEAVFGGHPIVGDTAAKMLDEGARMRPPPELRGLPQALVALLARGLDPVPARRYPSMDALLAELATVGPPPRRRYLAIAGAAALVLGGAAAATVLGARPRPRPQIDPAQVASMLDQIHQLQREKGELLSQIQDSQRKSDAEIERLAGELAARTREIEVLEGKLEQVAAVTRGKPVRLPAPPAPAPPTAFDPALVAAAVRPIERDLAGCFIEVTERTQADRASMHLTARVFPDGRVRSVELAGLEDQITRECVGASVRRVGLPVSDHVTVFSLDASYAAGALAVAVAGVSAEPAPPLIDQPNR
ncbi:MAG: protein kinase [Kofleriaceae bacterium]